MIGFAEASNRRNLQLNIMWPTANYRTYCARSSFCFEFQKCSKIDGKTRILLLVMGEKAAGGLDIALDLSAQLRGAGEFGF